ncbi:thioredoxin family protein [Saccharomonospora sp. NB11]|jgi:thiol-disulfide isomerase/thioredoxin|uniref:TlpA family protein disulfide reductase n=1 Tax=Saccharomonospora sp. NB11 TaxID=1642298 RepID=UPI0018D11DBC|nr:thioredoxin family protein [Saccharomonospora sp. NB11]
MTGLWVLVGTLVVGVLTGTLLSLRNGRIRRAMSTTPSNASSALPSAVADALDPHAITLVQLSTTFCGPCRHARAVLTRFADTTEGVTHVDLDVTDRPEVAQSLRVLRTPTTIAYAPEGTELLRISGVPTLDSVRTALAPHTRLTE